MNTKKVKKLRIWGLLCLVILTSCYSPFDIVYGRMDRKSTFFQNEYSPIDTLIINKIILCKNEIETRDFRFYSKGKININANYFGGTIVKSLNRKFKNVKFDFDSDTTRKGNCYYIKNRSLPSNYHLDLKYKNDYNINLTLNIEYNSGRNSESDGFWGLVKLEGDSHELKYVLRVAISNSNELIYVDNVRTTVKVLSEKDETINYEVPQNIIDSLVTKSLAEYKKRLK